MATALTWAAGEASVDRFRPKEVGNPFAEAADVAGINRVMVKNAALTCGLQGALLGLMLGLASGAGRRPVRPVATAGLSGLILGGVLGSAGSFGLSTAFFALADPTSPELIASLLMHGGVASLLGASGGLAFGVGSGQRGVAKAALGGLAGGLLGAVDYEFTGAVFLPVDKTGDPVSASGLARFTWHALTDLLAALGAATFLASSPKNLARGPEVGAASIP